MTGVQTCALPISLNRGTMTKDLVGLVDEGVSARAVTSEEFIAAIRENLEKRL